MAYELVSNLLLMLVLLAVCAGLGFQYNTLLPVYARDILHSGPAVYGWLFSAFGAGAPYVLFLSLLPQPGDFDAADLLRELETALTEAQRQLEKERDALPA